MDDNNKASTENKNSMQKNKVLKEKSEQKQNIHDLKQNEEQKNLTPTKNVPKLYASALLRYINCNQKLQQIIKKVLTENNYQIQEFYNYAKYMNKKSTIDNFKKIFTHKYQFQNVYLFFELLQLDHDTNDDKNYKRQKKTYDKIKNKAYNGQAQAENPNSVEQQQQNTNYKSQ
ncbi:hypothetical protein PPERSA_06184 [Pseudocohnilembus persalinus]|uniref:Uncharacterized protein n=1 Tax=Pseudocohnilembus persalinus TaxID=266149 RepID=A0A0V0R0E5_PSEPJ|nr:hypothetical protein PPERSA_06184 [Pseudocohnilembus persalinus]|eukprot:KRX08006.1 hypothetical protein PPERSA_06184 [Pseudocohnilembus persalinus]